MQRGHVSRGNIYYFYSLNILIKNSIFQICQTKTCKDKNGYYHSFKIQFEGRSKAKLRSLVKARSKEKCWVDLSQHKNKNDYYYNFKINLWVNLG